MTTSQDLTPTRTDASPAGAAPSPTAARRRTAGRLVRLAAALAAALAVLVGLAGPAGAATYAAGNFTGNTCLNAVRHSVTHNGMDGCVHKGAVAVGSWVDLQNAAYDGNRDGYSARATTRIFQYYGGRWVHTHNLTTATASTGAGTSNRAAAQRLPRVNGASHFYISTTICSYNVPNALNVSCATGNCIAISWTS